MNHIEVYEKFIKENASNYEAFSIIRQFYSMNLEEALNLKMIISIMLNEKMTDFDLINQIKEEK